MQIGGLIPCSLIDYPSKVAAVIFTVGCNFRCCYCYNPQLVVPESKTSTKLSLVEVFDFLKKRKGTLDGIVVSGGEPTLQGGLLPFLNKVKSLGYLVKLDTNGSKPEVLKKAMKKGLLDYVAMDVKAPLVNYSKFSKDDDSEHNYILESIKIIISSNLPHEFRTTAVKPFHDEDDLISLGKLVSSPNSRFVLQRFFKDKEMLNPEFAKTAEGFSEEELMRVQSTLQSMGINCSVR